MKRRYLVTGGAGFIGSHLCEALLAQGDSVVVLDNFCSGKVENLSGLGGDLEVIEGDIRSVASYRREIGAVDAVIHLAALISGYDSLSAPDDYQDVNVRGLLRVIEFAADQDIGRIILASSSTVYGNQPGIKLSESVLPEPLTVYAQTKLAGEHLLRLYGEANGYAHCSLRLFNVYGPRQATDHPYANVTCKFSHAAANGMPVKLFGDGEQSRDFVYVSDVVRAFVAVLEASQHNLYNVGTGQEARINDLLAALEGITGSALATERCPAWPNDIRSIRANTTRSENDFGFRPEVSLAEGLEKTVAHFRAPVGA